MGCLLPLHRRTLLALREMPAASYWREHASSARSPSSAADLDPDGMVFLQGELWQATSQRRAGRVVVKWSGYRASTACDLTVAPLTVEAGAASGRDSAACPG